MSGGTRGRSWICCHLGAREHYAVPRALHQAGRLGLLITDAWSEPGTIQGSITASTSTRLGQRFHAELGTASVRSFSWSLTLGELRWRSQRRSGWDLFLSRNEWFQRKAAAALPNAPAGRTMIFAHSYAAEGIFAEARRRGWRTVLGQIDPGPEQIAIQSKTAAERPEFGPPPTSPPPRYFESWRRECDLADSIVVNSEWSRESLLRAGVPERKLTTIALPYEHRGEVFDREYPAAFTAGRPLRVLFAGTASVAKGAADLLLAFDALEEAPIELTVVGDRAMAVPDRFLGHPRIKWVGRVDRSAVMGYYRACDLLVFPSHSDGFGMAQVEARGWGLPIVASRNCGRVVCDGETGILLNRVTPADIAGALRRSVTEPQMLARFSRTMRSAAAPGLASLSAGLIALEGR